MNREDIIAMAKEVGFSNGEIETCQLMLERFAALVASAEREACIKACEQVTADLRNYASAFEGITAETKFIRNIGAVVGEPFIEAIQARGQE
jgi:hypothetical protein